MLGNQIAVSCVSNDQISSAYELASRLNLSFVDRPNSNTSQQYHYLLLLTPHYLGLQKTCEKKIAPFYIDFLSGKMLHRIQQAGRRKELLARAIGIHPHQHPAIIDATAGLGRDSFILATLGFNVILLERSPIIAALLSDALTRATTDDRTAAIVERMHLIQADAMSQLQHTSADIIYLDPMFPARQKSASVKKEMVILQDLLGKDDDCEKLLRLALSCAAHRVVVKRPRLAENIANCTPSFSLMGKSSRFDVYVTSKPKR
ncbi:MAG: class I SAM-dependent methyltransferase [Gammaproteobacteria bacterium]|nr:class I SAM-dependent methyltransferase [Gammaproteobacteria bacterium]MCW5582586.1 class I SAM-dependent methyltransferase [Gammaproteobacteria bacterium]